MTVTLKMVPDRKSGHIAIEVDPRYNEAAMEHLDVLYAAAKREDYDANFDNDHKIAFWIADMMEVALAQWESPDSSEMGDVEKDGTIPGVPHIRESPVVDRFDLTDMEFARRGGQRND